MRRFVNRLDQTEFVRLLNQQFATLSEGGTFATAVVSTFFAPTQRLIVCNAGHPRPLLYQAAKRQWTLLGADPTSEEASPNNMPLGIIDVTEYEQFDVELESGDCVLSYTDALIESRDADGEMLGEAGLLRILRLLGDVEPQLLTKSLLREIADRYPENLTEDDVTVFWETVPAQYLPLALWLEADRMASLRITKETFSDDEAERISRRDDCVRPRLRRRAAVTRRLATARPRGR